MKLNSTTKKIPIWIIEYLKKRPASKDELITAFKIKQSTFYKHIKLLKETGYVLEMDKNLYELYEFKNQIDYKKSDREILVHIKHLASIMLSFEQNKIFEKSFKKIVYLGDKKNHQGIIDISNMYDYVDSLLEKRERMTYYTPYYCYTDEFLLDEFMEESLVQKEGLMPNRKETIFELYGKLADSYILKDGERVISKEKERIVIANGYEDKRILFKRLLRYDVLCKVMHPKKDVKEFKEMLLKTIKIFEEQDEVKQATKILP